MIDIATGKATPVADRPPNGDLLGYCWSPDGKRIAYTWREVPAGDQKEARSHLIVCDPDGRNQKTVLSETGKGETGLGLEGVDWR